MSLIFWFKKKSVSWVFLIIFKALKQVWKWLVRMSRGDWHWHLLWLGGEAGEVSTKVGVCCGLNIPPVLGQRALRLGCILSLVWGKQGRGSGVVGLESCQQSNVGNGVRLYCIRLAFCLSNSHILGTSIFLWGHGETNSMCLNNMLTVFIIFLGINSVLRNSFWPMVLEVMYLKHAHW